VNATLENTSLLELVPPPSVVKRGTGKARYAGTSLREVADRLIAAGMEQTRDPTRKLKEWIHAGRFGADGVLRAEPDLPPFHDLSKLAEWWRRNMTWRVPAYMTALERSGLPGCSEPIPADLPPGTSLQAPSMACAGKTALSFDVAQGGEDSSIEFIRALVRAGKAEMDRAQKENDSKAYWQARRQFDTDIETLRRWEKDHLKTQEGKGELVRARVVNAAVSRIFGVLSQTFTSAMLKLAGELAPELPAAALREMVYPHRDRAFAHLKSTQFALAYEARGATSSTSIAA